MDLEDVEAIVGIAYTLWKWNADYQDRKEKERIKAKPPKQKTKKRSRK